MRKEFLIFMIAVMLRFEATAQLSPPLQIAKNNGNITLSWSNLTSLFVLESTTNLSRPIFWDDMGVSFSTGSYNVTDVGTQKFFRLTELLPVFQFGVFYNLDMDCSPGQTFIMNGKVFANGNIWMCPTALATFNDTVSATLVVTNADDPNDQQNLTFNSGFLVYSGGQPNSHVAPLTLETDLNISTNLARAMLDLPPPGAGAPNDIAYAFSNRVYLYNEVDLIISNSISGTNVLGGGFIPTGTNLTIYFQDPVYPATWPATGHLTRLTNDFYTLKTGGWTNRVSANAGIDCYTNVKYAGWSFVTNVAFYDYRESDTVQAVQIDVAALNKWLTNALPGGGIIWNDLQFSLQAHGIDSIYIYNSVSLNSSQLPAVRLINGAQLPYTIWSANHSYWTAGLTVATPMPIYVLGNYNTQTNNGGGSSAGTTNTTWTRPAALMGDAITILSTSWNDNWNAGTTMSSRNAGSTTVNAACLEGIVQSVTAGGTKHYSGGLQNFLRLLENWNGTTLTYNGSIVVMFPSIYATNYWIQPGTYYDVPTRHWGFDANFSKGFSYLPPLTPSVANFISP